MNNASLIYENTQKYSDIQKFLDQKIPEDMFLDFKAAQYSERGKMQDGDKSHYSKAASGFAHQEGGVLVWGIGAQKDEDGANYADELKPIDNIRTFYSDLQDFTQYSTEPVVDGIEHKVIYENDDEGANKGFAVSLFPKSDREHIAKGKNTSDFYKRYGDSFVPLGTADIKVLFLRTLSPDLDLRVMTKNEYGGYRCLSFSIENRGKGMAKNCSVYLGITSDDKSMKKSWNRDKIKATGITGQNELSGVVRLLDVLQSDKYTEHVKFESGAVICPGEQVCIGVIWCTWKQDGFNEDINIKYKILAENMIPKEGSIKNRTF